MFQQNPFPQSRRQNMVDSRINYWMQPQQAQSQPQLGPTYPIPEVQVSDFNPFAVVQQVNQQSDNVQPMQPQVMGGQQPNMQQPTPNQPQLDENRPWYDNPLGLSEKAQNFLLRTGTGMMAAGGRPGATFFGTAGESMGNALQQQEQERIQQQEIDARNALAEQQALFNQSRLAETSQYNKARLAQGDKKIETDAKYRDMLASTAKQKADAYVARTNAMGKKGTSGGVDGNKQFNKDVDLFLKQKNRRGEPLYTPEQAMQKANELAALRGNKGKPTASPSANTPPVAGAKLAPDGSWYIKTPSGKWGKVE